MQNRTLGDLILLIESLLGGTFNNPSEMRIVLRLINRRLTTAFNRSQSWPRYLKISEERQIAAYELSGGAGNTDMNQFYRLAGTSDGTGAKSGTNVYRGLTDTGSVIVKRASDDAWIVLVDVTVTEDNDAKTVAITDIAGDNSDLEFVEGDTIKKNNLEDVNTWTAQSGQSGALEVEAYNLIPYTQSGKDTIGEFIRIHRKKAFLNKSSVEYDFYLDENGGNILNISSTTDNTANVTYKKQLTLISHSESGADDDAVRDGYRTSSSNVPNEFFSYIAHSVYADLLRSESQFQDAIREETVAEDYLSAELEKLDIIANNNNLKKKFSTHLNRNSR